MFYFSRTVFLLFLSEEFLNFSGCDVIGSGIQGKVHYSRRSNSPVLRRLVGKSLRDCVIECGLRSSCVGLNYERLAKMCELLGATVLPFEVDTSKGWLFVQMDETLRKDIMENYCGRNDNCPAGQTCYKEKQNFRCGIKAIQVSTVPPSTTSAASTKVLTTSAALTTTTLTSLVTTITQNLTSSTTTKPVTSTTSSTIMITIDNDDWYTLESDTRKRQLALVADVALNWKNAMIVCNSNGLHLAHVNTIGEREKINDWLLTFGQVGVSVTSNSDPADDEFWVGGEYDPESTEWFWKTASGKMDRIGDVSGVWGTEKPTTEFDKHCVNLYKDSKNRDLYSLRNSHCNIERKFICERDLIDITLDTADWFIFNSTEKTREMAFVGNPSLAWEKAQIVCEKNKGTLAHVYNSAERESLGSLSFLSVEKLWTGAKYDIATDKWYWWSNNSSTDIYVEPTLWAFSESSKASNCLYLSQGQVPGMFTIDDSNCTENNGFLCQRQINLTISTDKWFPLEEGVVLREIAFVNRLNLNWQQSQEMCEWNNGTLVHIYSDTDLKLLQSRLQNNNIKTNNGMWTGGKTLDVNEWVWWSNDGHTHIEWTKLLVGAFDSTTGECMLLADKLSNTECIDFHPFLCQRETAFKIPEKDWFPVSDRMMAHVAHESNWESAMLICDANGGILASVTNRDEIGTIQTQLEKRGVTYPLQLWLNGLYSEKQMMWLWQEDKSPVDEGLWLSGFGGKPDLFPDNACVLLFDDSFRNDMCADEYSFLCQR